MTYPSDFYALPRPDVKAVSVGTTVESLYTRREGQVIDFLIQNLSANSVYLLGDEDAPTTQGIKIVSGGSHSKDNWTGDILLVADGAASDVRVELMIHPSPWRSERVRGGL